MENLCHQTLKKYLAVLGTTLRPQTVAHYRRHIEGLIKFLRKHHPNVDSFDMLRRTPHIEGWLQFLATAKPPLKNNTRRDHIQHLRRFFKDIREWDWPGAPPPGLIVSDDFPPCDRFLPKPLPPEVDAVLIEGLQIMGDSLCLGLLLARWSGLRVGELAGLEMDCLTQNPGKRYSLRVPLGKLHNERVIPIDAETASLIETIRIERGERPPWVDPETGRSIDLLFCNAKGRKLHRNRFFQKLKSVAKSLGISHNVHPHRLRHTYATELLRCGVSLPGVMKLLGHRTLKMTMRYVEVTNEDLGKAYLKAVAKARKQYAELKRFHANSETECPQGTLERIDEAFDELIARIQSVRFDHPIPLIRKKLQRFVERLRIMQKEIPNLLG